MTITSNEADRLMNFAAFIYLRNSDSCDADEATEFARDMFKQFAVVEGITEVDETDKEEDTDDECCGNCEECDDWNWCQNIDDDCDGNCDECDEQCFTEEPDDLEIWYNPYMGGYDYDC